MHVITFYSFKGGVGRTMALLNVAVELAQTGRRVLVVDFDLEAPGVDTYNLPRPKIPVPGIVDYVTEYLETGTAPSFEGHYYECVGIGKQDGQLWVMPSGLQDRSYESRLCSIDWQELYCNRDGYLLFENLKAEWDHTLKPDYVLIDSRTGHTDVSGICTRQLPDSVALVFHPDKQNLRGLSTVVENIRQEADGPRKKPIKLHFVMSNVPDLDDEDEILARMMRGFREVLGYYELAGTIHRYSSLSLLNQIVFTQDRPKSRLTKQYRRLAKELVSGNLQDRHVALAFLADAKGQELPAKDFEEALKRIKDFHKADGKVLTEIAKVKRSQQRLAAALDLLNEAIEAGYTGADAYLTRAEVRLLLRSRDEATEDVLKIFDLPAVSYRTFDAAAAMLAELAPRSMPQVIQSPAFEKLPINDRLMLIDRHCFDDLESINTATKVLQRLASEPNSPDVSRRVAGQLALALIAAGDLRGAVRAFGDHPPSAASLAIEDAFNLGMAEWGASGAPSTEMFERVAELYSPELESANVEQCLGIVHSALGARDAALRHIANARALASGQEESIFSAWRYRRVPADLFLSDLDEQEGMTHVGVVRPKVLFESSAVSS